MKNINIHEFARRYKMELSYMIECRRNGQEIAGYREAADAFYDFIDEHETFVREFCAFIGDIIATSFESAAFMFALEAVSA